MGDGLERDRPKIGCREPDGAPRPGEEGLDQAPEQTKATAGGFELATGQRYAGGRAPHSVGARGPATVLTRSNAQSAEVSPDTPPCENSQGANLRMSDQTPGWQHPSTPPPPYPPPSYGRPRRPGSNRIRNLPIGACCAVAAVIIAATSSSCGGSSGGSNDDSGPAGIARYLVQAAPGAQLTYDDPANQAVEQTTTTTSRWSKSWSLKQSFIGVSLDVSAQNGAMAYGPVTCTIWWRGRVVDRHTTSGYNVVECAYDTDTQGK